MLHVGADAVAAGVKLRLLFCCERQLDDLLHARRMTLTELAEHMRHSGTAAGARVRDAAAELAHASSSLALSQVEGGMKTLLNQADLLASLAAGVLRGFADRLHPGNSAADAPTPATRKGDDAPH